MGDTYDDEITSRIARDVLSKITNDGWPLGSSVRDCYNQARQTTNDTNILYCIALDILNYKLNDGFIIKRAELQSVIERTDATLSALGRKNETPFAVTHAMRISNRVRDMLEIIVALASQPEPPPAAPPAANARPPSPTSTASNSPEAPAPAETPPPSATAAAPPAANPPPTSPTSTASNPPETLAPAETPPAS